MCGLMQPNLQAQHRPVSINSCSMPCSRHAILAACSRQAAAVHPQSYFSCRTDMLCYQCALLHVMQLSNNCLEYSQLVTPCYRSSGVHIVQPSLYANPQEGVPAGHGRWVAAPWHHTFTSFCGCHVVAVARDLSSEFGCYQVLCTPCSCHPFF